MSLDPDPFDEMNDQAAVLFEPSKTAGFRSLEPGSDLLMPSRSNAESDPSPSPAELRKQVQLLSQQLAEEHQHLVESQQLNQRLLALNHFGQGLENAPNPELTAQSMAKTLIRLVPCGIVCIFSYHLPEQRFKLLACAGPDSHLVPGSFLPDSQIPVIRQALQEQHISACHEQDETGQALVFGDKVFPSLVAAPLLRRGELRGLILLGDPGRRRFGPADRPVIEAASVQLVNAWEYAQQNETLTEFAQTVSMMSVIQETGSLLEMIASIARRTLNASFTLVAMLNQSEWIMRGAGRAPQLLGSLQNGAAAFLEEAIRSPYTFRLRDLSKDERASAINLDSADLRTLLASPIRINGSATGILLAFGKNGDCSFSDMDVFLAELLVSQAAVNLESCYLNQELRANLKTTQLLYDLSLNISQAENLNAAARAIGLTAYRLLQARRCGLILFSSDGLTEAEVRFPTDEPGLTHPYSLIQQAMDSRQTIYLSETERITKLAIPIQTLRRCYGALWMELSDEVEETHHPTEEIRILINQAAVALERSILLEETRQQAHEISVALLNLEKSYEDLLYGLTKALDARDRETQGHSKRVMELSELLGIEMGLSRDELKSLKRGALLHDIGKIGISDTILLKDGPLDNVEWQFMRQHPQIGAQIVQEIQPLQNALPVIAFHQERWDGSGYPLHLRGTDIPLLARIFAVVDVFDALTSDRPYRKALCTEEALTYLASQSGIHFDPDIVARFDKMIRENGGTPLLPDPPVPNP